mgnify:CR=1 FL=1
MEQTDPATFRICRMEAIFDILLSADPSTLRTDPLLASMLAELTAYYDSPQWLADYEADEQGLLPPDLKRGVLSQDGVYDLLSDIRQLSDQ